MRVQSEDTEQAHIVGAPVEGKTVCIFDDMISTAGTIVGAAKAAKANGARRVFIAATHGLFVDKALDRLREAPVEQIVVTDSVPISPDKKERLPNLHVVSVARLLADAIHRIHGNESLSVLFADETK